MPDDINHRVADKIRVAMLLQNKGQRELAEVLGISQPQVSERLRGLVAIRVDELEKIANFLGVPASEFLERAA
jgi:transcriptional regulator with XRE-family HTH domain